MVCVLTMIQPCNWFAVTNSLPKWALQALIMESWVWLKPYINPSPTKRRATNPNWLSVPIYCWMERGHLFTESAHLLPFHMGIEPGTSWLWSKSINHCSMLVPSDSLMNLEITHTILLFIFNSFILFKLGSSLYTVFLNFFLYAWVVFLV